MRFDRLITAFLTLTLIASMGFAQDLPTMSTEGLESDPKSEKILKASRAKVEGLSDLSASFSYTLENPNLDKPIVKKGKMTLKGKMYTVDLSDQAIYCDGSSVWIHLKDDAEVQVVDYDPEESFGIDAIFKLYETGTKSRHDGKDGDADKVSIFSTDKNSDFWKVEMWINSSSKMISKAVSHMRNGTTTTYTISNYKTNIGLTKKDFQFDPSNKDVEIYDDRMD